jgi:hypothetical protein
MFVEVDTTLPEGCGRHPQWFAFKGELISFGGE